ncbi:EAL domain-containing protein [Congregibacter variabilis]|uniref:EAL domain-containing protein n=1 Tax=Congregibacter variabilis TaxID=3081200 RepID=A0ABZ0I772_9GAMM|nr:EAL domain-containing protein [Congregibacter sp. IMCC43200]
MTDLSALTRSSYNLTEDSLIGELSTLRYVFNSRGIPEIIDGNMVLRGEDGDYTINGNNEIVDQILEMSGSQATIFQKIGDEAVRISTNVKDLKGERALGTIVSAPVYDAVINRGETFLGVADVVGTIYLTAYEKILDANNNIIGILFVGITGDALFEAMLPTISSMNFGETGHLHVFDLQGNPLLSQDRTADSPTVASETLEKMLFMKDLARDKPLSIAEPQLDQSFVSWFSYVDELEWILVAHVYPKEFLEPLKRVRSLLFYFLGTLVTLAIAVSFYVGRVVSHRAGELVSVTQQLGSGDLDAAEANIREIARATGTRDEFTFFANALREATHSLKERDGKLQANEKRLQGLVEELRQREIERDLQREKLQQQEREVVIARDKLEAIAAATNAGIFAIGQEGSVSYLSPRFTELFGYETLDLMDGVSWSMIAGNDNTSREALASVFRVSDQRAAEDAELPSNLEVAIKTKSNRLRNVLLTAKFSSETLVVTLSDISEQKVRQDHIQYLSQHDSLTGLPNRMLLGEKLDWHVKQTKRSNDSMCVAFLDLDGFKLINDSHGHEAGDFVLKETAKRLLSVTREIDTVARLGGDEFAIIMSQIKSRGECTVVFRRILETINSPISYAGESLQVSCSIGVAFYAQSETSDGEQLLRQADKSMYDAKIAGKNRYAIFDAEQDLSLQIKHEQLNFIEAALTNQEFELFYQPKVNIRTGVVLGAEALLRWRTPDGQIRDPDSFLPAVHETQLAKQLGAWVLTQALSDLNGLIRQDHTLQISINVFPEQFLDQNFVPSLVRQLDKFPNIKPSMIELEIVETEALNELEEASRVIRACADLGVHCALDDFGTGFSSLSHLKYLPVTTLKIDKSFVTDVLIDPDDAAIVEATMSLAHAFDRKVIAEGVETIEQGLRLLEMGCDIAQGYAIAKPMPLRSFLTWLAGWESPEEWARYTASVDDGKSPR